MPVRHWNPVNDDVRFFLLTVLQKSVIEFDLHMPDLYVDVAQKPKAKIKEARVEALRAGFKQCYVDKDFQTIVTIGNKIPQNLLTEDEVLLQFYDIAQSKL